MKELLRYWEDTFYTNIATFFIAVIPLFISIKRGRQNAKLKPLQIFLLGYVIDIFLTFLITASNSLNDDLIIYTDFIDTVIEFLAFFFFIKTHIVSKKIKKVLNPVLPFFIGGVLLYSIYYFIYYKLTQSLMDQHFLQNIFTIQAILLLIACAFYYIDLFTKEPKIGLTEQPSFWAITGLTLFMLSTLPFSFFGQYLISADYQLYGQLFSIFDIFYCLLFFMIIKAYYVKGITTK